MNNQHNENALYRMQTDDHICPFGLRARDLLKRQGIEFADNLLSSREAADRLKAQLGVKTTPQVVLGGERIGGFEDLQRHFGKTPKSERGNTYFPVAALFSLSALSAIAISVTTYGAFQPLTALMHFVGLSMIMLGLLKLQDVDGFVNGFLGYDLLAQRYVPYAFVYPFAEALAGVLMLAEWLPVLSLSIMMFIGGIGGVSVVKAVYIDRRDIKCACVGGGSKVPLGVVSLLENLMMLTTGFWMLWRLVFA